MYLETMEQVLGSTAKTIIDTGSANGPGVVPYLPLPSLAPPQVPPQTPAGAKP
jgi:membrane protease subunit HflK